MSKDDELYEQASGLSRKANELFAQCDNLRQQAKQVRARYQPRIDELKAEADDLADQFKDLFRQSRDAYSEGDGTSAKELSEEAQEKQEECEDLNEEVGSLIAKVKRETADFYLQINEKKQEAKSCIEEAKRLRAQARGESSEPRHHPFTSEVSKPHKSTAEPREHVDVIYYGAGGIKDKDLTVSHIVDRILVKFGWDIEAFRKRRKKEPE